MSKFHSAFTPVRSITDNIIVASEVMKYMKLTRRGDSSFQASKLDMSKAYDRVDWGFVEGIMTRLGFDER